MNNISDSNAIGVRYYTPINYQEKQQSVFKHLMGIKQTFKTTKQQTSTVQ